MIKLPSILLKISSLHLTSATQASGKSDSLFLSATLEEQALENGGSGSAYHKPLSNCLHGFGVVTDVRLSAF